MFFRCVATVVVIPSQGLSGCSKMVKPKIDQYLDQSKIFSNEKCWPCTRKCRWTLLESFAGWSPWRVFQAENPLRWELAITSSQDLITLNFVSSFSRVGVRFFEGRAVFWMYLLQSGHCEFITTFSSHNSTYTSYHGGNHVCQAVKNDNYVSDEDAVWQLAIHSPLWWSWASMLLLGQLQAPTTTFMLHKYASCLSPRRWVYKYTPHSEMQC